MSNILRVIDSFFIAEVGDIFNSTEDGMYSLQKSEEFHKAGDDGDVNAVYSSALSISSDYAEQLVKDGYLEEIIEKLQDKRNFVNVFDEIDTLIKGYNTQLENIDEDMKDEPQCLKVEKTTVLTNILSVLNHLKNLRK